jgi:alkylation response protein AidB-like acyl-CoA dehydrogenase
VTAGYEPTHEAKRWDALLGDPEDPTVLFSYARCMALDDEEQFPEDICAGLNALGLPAHYVPATYGGRLRDFDHAATIVRLVARRDLTVAIAHFKTFLGAAPTWVAGTPSQALELAATIFSGEPVALALTERDRGSDLLATQTRAESVGTSQFRVTGEKWLINNGRRAAVVTTLVRTGSGTGPQGLSLLMMDRRTAGASRMTALEKAPTHGIRGADISGVRFAGALVDRDRVVGGLGKGADTILRALQLTRILTTPLSLGAADQAVRITYDFCASRELYGGHLGDLPLVRRRLGRATATLFVAEAVVLLSCRAINALPGELSVISAVAKALVPTLVEELVGDLGELLGARAFLLDVLQQGRFQKVERDHRIIGIFDGSTAVNQNYLAHQFARLGRRYRQGSVNRAGIAATAELVSPLPTFDPSRLAVFSRGGCSIVQVLPELLDDDALDGVVPRSLLDAVREAADSLHAELDGWRFSSSELPAYAFDLAARYELCYAAAACLLLWRHNAGRVDDGLWTGGGWLLPALALLAERLSGDPGQYGDEIFIDLGGRTPEPGWGPPFSIIPAELAPLR